MLTQPFYGHFCCFILCCFFLSRVSPPKLNIIDYIISLIHTQLTEQFVSNPRTVAYAKPGVNHLWLTNVLSLEANIPRCSSAGIEKRRFGTCSQSVRHGVIDISFDSLQSFRLRLTSVGGGRFLGRFSSLNVIIEGESIVRLLTWVRLYHYIRPVD